jgi:hypothetical protein
MNAGQCLPQRTDSRGATLIEDWAPPEPVTESFMFSNG